MRVLLLTALFFSCFVSSAAASSAPLEEGLERVGSVVKSVVELPGGAPPPVPDLPVAPSTQPGTGSVEREVVPRPAPQPPPPKSVERPEVPDPVRSVSGAGSPGGASDVVAGAGGATGATPPVDSARPSLDPDPAPDTAPAGPGPDRRSAGLARSDPAPGSVRAAVPAPLREWLAYLWPAIPLGPLGSALATQVAELAPALLSGIPSDFTRPARSPDGASPPDDPGSAPAAQAARPDSDLFSLSHSGGMSFLVTVITVLATLVGLVALARLAVGEDFFSLRWLR